jgi:hypothetical protein
MLPALALAARATIDLNFESHAPLIAATHGIGGSAHFSGVSIRSLGATSIDASQSRSSRSPIARAPIARTPTAAGQKQTSNWLSALPPKADIAGRQSDVRFVPKADIVRTDKLAFVVGFHTRSVISQISPSARQSKRLSPFS